MCVPHQYDSQRVAEVTDLNTTFKYIGIRFSHVSLD